MIGERELPVDRRITPLGQKRMHRLLGAAAQVLESAYPQAPGTAERQAVHAADLIIGMQHPDRDKILERLTAEPNQLAKTAIVFLHTAQQRREALSQ